jgi:hypothetical protein
MNCRSQRISRESLLGNSQNTLLSGCFKNARFRDELSKPPKPFAIALFCWLKTLLTIIVSNLALVDDK